MLGSWRATVFHVFISCSPSLKESGIPPTQVIKQSTFIKAIIKGLICFTSYHLCDNCVGSFSLIIDANMPVDTGQKQDGGWLQLQSTAVCCLQVNTGIICNSYTPNQLLTLLSHAITRSKQKHVCLPFWSARNKHRMINIKSSFWISISSRDLTWGTNQTCTNHCLPSPDWIQERIFIIFQWFSKSSPVSWASGWASSWTEPALSLKHRAETWGTKTQMLCLHSSKLVENTCNFMDNPWRNHCCTFKIILSTLSVLNGGRGKKKITIKKL